MKQLQRLYNNLFLQDINGLKLPAWSRQVYPEPLMSAMVHSFNIRTETNFMKRIKGGMGDNRYIRCVLICVEIV